MKNYVGIGMMELRRGFKTEANDYSREFRSELGLKAHEPLLAWRLAEHLGIPVVPLSEFEREISREVLYLKGQGQRSFSAVTVFDGSRRLIVHNDSHHRYRQSANIFHELGHGILQHPPMAPFSEIGCRNFNKEYEDEANWLGFALLISAEAALHIVRTGMAMEAAMAYYCASKDVVKMRLGVTGANKRMQRSRKRA